MAKKCPKVQKSIKQAGFHSIGATIRTRRESVPPVCGIFFLLISFYFVKFCWAFFFVGNIPLFTTKATRLNEKGYQNTMSYTALVVVIYSLKAD